MLTLPHYPKRFSAEITIFPIFANIGTSLSAHGSNPSTCRPCHQGEPRLAYSSSRTTQGIQCL